MTLRLATAADLPLLAAIERSAAERFGPDDLPPHLRGDTLAQDDLQRALLHRLLWVALAPSGQVAGFLVAQDCADALHVQEVSVTPEHGGAGLGRELLQAAIEHGRDTGYAALTLTTFDHLPWNRPFYERLGFRVLTAEDCEQRLRGLLDAETRAGLRNRVAMRRNLP